MTPHELLNSMRGRLVVSCQAWPGEPLRAPEHMAAMAESVARAPIGGIRAGVHDLAAIREVVDLPLIGLWKDGDTDVHITPTAQHARAVVEAGADIVAIDATRRSRPDARPYPESIKAVRDLGRIVMADVSTVAEGVAAAELGADVISTTLSGYTPYSRRANGPDLDLVGGLASKLDIPVVAEGRYATPQQAHDALSAGAWTVVVGAAITSPTVIAERFARAMS